ncbi:hypothetical protein [Candidatus Williamhamiltonella defendens]|uniref:hypothetical protein n=1 Tax=Candidatus Williamhamiltonella defendens TaxID=138072 RepID=UPI001650E95D|nr:hypothetical protein [Candidatus Hamiltonella defensa]
MFEETLSDSLGYPRLLFFTSDYSANQALLASLLEPCDHVLADCLSHAFLLEGMLYSSTLFFHFEYHQLDSLQNT